MAAKKSGKKKQSTKGKKGFGTIELVNSQPSTDSDDLKDPALFEEMNQVRIPKLERKGREFLKQKDFVKRETEKRNGLEEECLLIMHDHEIPVYRVPGLTLRIKETEKIEGETD